MGIVKWTSLRLRYERIIPIFKTVNVVLATAGFIVGSIPIPFVWYKGKELALERKIERMDVWILNIDHWFVRRGVRCNVLGTRHDSLLSMLLDPWLNLVFLKASISTLGVRYSYPRGFLLGVFRCATGLITDIHSHCCKLAIYSMWSSWYTALSWEKTWLKL